jgi:hypothetical protein
MSKSSFHVIGYPKVKVRCQFENFPGVSWITMEFDPHSRGNRVNGVIETGYGTFPLDDQVINGYLKRQKVGAAFIFTKPAFEELAAAVEGGMETLRNLVKASGHDKNYF